MSNAPSARHTPNPLHLYPQRPACCAIDVNPLLLKRSSIACFALLTSACSFFVPRSDSPNETPAEHALVIASARNFPYLPAREGHITPDRIANTATTSIIMKQNVEAAVHDAVASAWRKAGIVVTTHDKLVLSGRIEALSVDDARGMAVWTLTIAYFVNNASTRQTAYVATNTVHMHRQKFTNPAFALDDIVRLSIEAIVRDPALRAALQPTT
jgi:hypothetical protein